MGIWMGMWRLLGYALALGLVWGLWHLDLTWYASFRGFLIYWTTVIVVLIVVGTMLLKKVRKG